MAVEVRPASAGPETRRSPAADRRALSAESEPRTLAARKAYPEEPPSPKPEPEEDDAPLDLTVRKEISVCEFARHSFADPSDYVRTQMILRQSQDYLASGRDSGTESDDSNGRLSPGEDAISGKAYKKSLMKRYSKWWPFLSDTASEIFITYCVQYSLSESIEQEKYKKQKNKIWTQLTQSQMKY